MGTLSRQFLATHRPFRAVIMDTQGGPLLFVGPLLHILWLHPLMKVQLRRPFAWINSRMFVHQIRNGSELEVNAEPTHDILGEVQQIWHPWRRRYDLFLRYNSSFPSKMDQLLLSQRASAVFTKKSRRISKNRVSFLSGCRGGRWISGLAFPPCGSRGK